jgi:hypothetical protein
MVLLAKAGRDPFGGLGLPRAGERRADLPDAAANTDERAVMEVDVGVAYDDVYTNMGIEPKLCATLVFVAVAVRRCMRWGPRPGNYDRLAGTRRHHDPLATPKRDGYHQCDKKLCETNHDRYPQSWGYRPIQVSP